jgi:thiol-disulfide isomerase/thioredoxin
MNASRARGGALVAALLVLVALLASPTLRSVVRHAAYHLGVLSPPRPVAAGQPLGAVVVTSLDGSQQRLQPRPGRRLLINVFATWCIPCQEEAPFFASAAERLAHEGIDVVGVDQAEPPQSVARFMTAYRLTYPAFIDSSGSSALSLDARVIPTTLLIGRDNVVKSIHVGPIDESELLAMTGERR